MLFNRYLDKMARMRRAAYLHCPMILILGNICILIALHSFKKSSFADIQRSLQKRTRESPLKKFLISIHVIGYSRPKSLKTLLHQIGEAKYDADLVEPIDLYVRIDGGGLPEVVEAASAFEWHAGRKHILVSNVSNGLRNMWTQIYPHSDDEVLIIFEDDIRVSPFFLDWTIHLLKEYGGNLNKPRDSSLFGLSLSPIQLDEISYPFVKWNASKFIQREHLYLHSVPSSWGGVYFADRWKEFLLFFRVRIQPPYFNVTEEAHQKFRKGVPSQPIGDPNLYVPSSRTNVWAKSWKRFLVEYCHGRAMFTLYTQMPGRLGFATPLQLSGAHVPAGGVPSDTGARGPSRDMLKNERVSHILEDHEAYQLLLQAPVGDTARLAHFDLWGRPTNRQERAADARRFLQRILSKDPRKYGPLVRFWGPIR